MNRYESLASNKLDPYAPIEGNRYIVKKHIPFDFHTVGATYLLFTDYEGIWALRPETLKEDTTMWHLEFKYLKEYFDPIATDAPKVPAK